MKRKFFIVKGAIHSMHSRLQTTYRVSEDIEVLKPRLVKFRGESGYRLMDASELIQLLDSPAPLPRFIDSDGVIHVFDVRINACTLKAPHERMELRVEEATQHFRTVCYVDPEGEIEDTESYVVWDHLDELLREISK